MTPSRTADEANFRALARSSPWLWRTLRCTVRWQDSRRSASRPEVRAWLRRPGDLRVEGGETPYVVQGAPGPARALLTSDGGAPGEWASAPPKIRADGLLAWRDPLDTGEHDVPMWGGAGYEWVAIFDPRELADGLDRDAEPPRQPVFGTVLTDTAQIEHRGRRALSAVVAPTKHYEPRCSCCPLLFTDAQAKVLAAQHGGKDVTDLMDGRSLPMRFLALLDAQTGVLVSLTALDGERPGDGVEVMIEGVDEDLPDNLFAEPPRRRRGLPWRPRT